MRLSTGRVTLNMSMVLTMMAGVVRKKRRMKRQILRRMNRSHQDVPRTDRFSLGEERMTWMWCGGKNVSRVSQPSPPALCPAAHADHPAALALSSPSPFSPHCYITTAEPPGLGVTTLGSVPSCEMALESSQENRSLALTPNLVWLSPATRGVIIPVTTGDFCYSSGHGWVSYSYWRGFPFPAARPPSVPPTTGVHQMISLGAGA